MKNFSVSLIDFFIPRFCPACKARLSHGVFYICDNCLLKIKKPEQERIKFEYKRNFSGTGYISDFTSLFLFEKDKELQQIIHALKYEKRFLLGVFLGKMLGEKIKKDFSNYQIDMVTPVPLHHLKKAEREFNQSYYIAKGICKITGIKSNSYFLKRIRYTESQTALNSTERKKNMSEAFICRKKLNGENILIVDDVITTGTTINECGKALLKAGAGKIYAASAAIAD